MPSWEKGMSGLNVVANNIHLVSNITAFDYHNNNFQFLIIESRIKAWSQPERWFRKLRVSLL